MENGIYFAEVDAFCEKADKKKQETLFYTNNP